jgi:prepilin peptidase CpaA
MIEGVALLLFPALMVFTAFSDMFTMKIPNFVSVALIIGFFALALYLQIPAYDILLHVSCALVVLVITLALFYYRIIGAGDAKLATATALWLGWEYLIAYLYFTSFAGAGLCVLVLLSHWKETPPEGSRFKFLARLKAHNVPYGVALAIGALLTYPQSEVFMRIGVAGT